MSQPKLFIGSSKKNLRVAKVLGEELEQCATVIIWDEGVFDLNQGILEVLLNKLDESDFAVLVLAKDDVNLSNDEFKFTTRDNVLFECGLFMGRLGRDRVFIVYDESIDLKIPSDLAGITLAPYDGSRIEGSDAAAAVRKASRLISDAIKKPMFSYIVGEWRSQYSLTSEVGYPLAGEDIEIKPAKGGICMRISNNTKDDDYIVQGNLVEGKYLMGHWKDITSGAFLLTLNSRCNIMYGYYTGPDENFGTRYATWVLAKKDGVEEDKIKERLERGIELLNGTVVGVLKPRYGRVVDGTANEQWSFIPSAAAYSQESWSRLINEASKHLDMMGISLAGWKSTRGFGNQLVQLASSGCRVRILLMDPNSESLQHRINPELEDLMSSQIVDTITACRDYYQKIADQADGIELRTVTNGTINLYVIRNEAEGIGVPYLYSERSAESPLWRCRQGTRLYEVLGNEFEALWSKNEPGEPTNRLTSA